MKFYIIPFLLFSLGFPALSPAYDFKLPERRKSQYETTEGYAIFPFPYSLPGVGSGISLVGGATNINEGYSDVYGLLLSGGVTGVAAAIDDLHIINQKLILEIGGSAISKATITNYGQRGMRSNKNDFNLIEISDTNSIGGRLTATYFQRRIEFYSAYYYFQSRLERIRNSDGEIVLEVDNPETEKADQKILGIRFDLTDDYQDPHKGFRLDISGWYTPTKDSGPEYLLLDLNASVYIPINKRSTWVFNYFHSDAFVFTKGETQREKVIEQLGIDCDAINSADDQDLCNQLIDNTIAENTFGTASSLGGFSRLRSYPQGRYWGAHSRFFGTEFRWNITDELTPFNLYLIKDVRTAIQIAFFFETGTIADVRSDIGRDFRKSCGIGFRIVTASGSVFRGDFGYGDEGFQPNIFIGYPWEI